MPETSSSLADAEVVVGPSVLLDERLQVLLGRCRARARAAESVGRLPAPRAARLVAVAFGSPAPSTRVRRPRPRTARRTAARASVRVAANGRTTTSQVRVSPSWSTSTPLAPDGRHLPLRFGDGAAQGEISPGRAILTRLLCGSPGAGCRNAPVSAAELEDLHPLVDEDARRRVAGQQHAVEVLGDVDLAARRRHPVSAIGDGSVRATRVEARGEPQRARQAPCARRSCSALSTTENSWPKPEMLSVRPSSRIARLVQRVVKAGEDPLLQRLVEVDEDVAAAHEIELRERRVAARGRAGRRRTGRAPSC